MRDSNYLRDALRAAGEGPLDSCTLCAAIISRPYEEEHNLFHQADYRPFAADAPGAAAATCKLCGVLIDQSRRDAHDQVHHADYEPFAADGPGAAETCKLCGILTNPSWREAHDHTHA